MNGIAAFKSERFVVALNNKGDRRKLFQVVIRESDGSIFVAFPYFSESVGLLTLLTLKANVEFPANLSLECEGKVTGHKVKYSHHPDGTTHFSQDGKIYTKVRKKSCPLSMVEGHLFTIQVYGYNKFALLKEHEKKMVKGKNKTILNIECDIKESTIIKFCGYLYSETQLRKNSFSFGATPSIVCKKSNGERIRGILLENPYIEESEKHYMILNFEVIGENKDVALDASLSFIGGFDHASLAMNHSKDSTFLALAYPATRSYQDLVQRIGSIDFVPPNA